MLSADFKKCLEDVFCPEDAGKVLAALECPPSVSVRMNPSKWIADEGKLPKIAGSNAVGMVPWNGWGYFLEKRPVFTLDPLIHAGVYYVQDSSAMFVGYVFRQMLGWMLKDGSLPQWRNVRVLDLCAAPGGKTTDLAASLRELTADRFILVSNEVMKSRIGTLADNVALWGDPNVVVTSADPAAFANLNGFFDIVLADVPCSGEGMFRKDIEAAEQWSAETVALCASRQRRILADVWPALAPGGLMIYSTCTFNRAENDGNVGWCAEELGGDIIKADCPYEGPVQTKHGFVLAPGLVPGEGQYCAVIRKHVGGDVAIFRTDAFENLTAVDTKNCRARKICKNGNNNHIRANSPLPEEELSKMFTKSVSLKNKNELIVAIPIQIETDLKVIENSLRPVTSGIAVGMVKANRLIPSPDLALSTILSQNAFPDAELDKKAALEFLHRDCIRLNNSPLGYMTVSYRSHRLGFVKNIGNRCNNLHPMSRRIIMNVNYETNLLDKRE